MNMQQIIETPNQENAFSGQEFDVKKWLRKNHLYVENKGESLAIKCQL